MEEGEEHEFEHLDASDSTSADDFSQTCSKWRRKKFIFW